MATYTFDDGSTITNDEIPGGWTTSATPATDSGVMSYTGDLAEQNKFGQFYGGGAPWYEQLAMYGATRAIDAHFMSAAVDKSAAAATYAGANGKTYTTGAANLQGLGGMSPLVLLLIAGALVYAIAD